MTEIYDVELNSSFCSFFGQERLKDGEGGGGRGEGGGVGKLQISVKKLCAKLAGSAKC